VRIDFYTGCLQVQSFNHWFAACGNKDRITVYKVRSAVRSIRISQSYPVVRIMDRLSTDIQTNLDSFLLHHFPNAFRNIRIIAGHESVSCFEKSHFTSEAGVHRSKLQSDIASAYNNQVLWQNIQFQKSGTGVHISTLLNTLYTGNNRCRAGIDKNLFSLQFDFFFGKSNLHRIG